ncbi:phenylacetate-CoA oxygenase subunit PaaI [Putridiphycobacter roseus]|uniref:Phenylacetate-CoA oxygenase subunit PaaI n=1 Tax=Putridiphycobacter roseus TaxID=2219161 RepID=A0A2W1NQC0_9FLAO|nr:1,2-phenylacetyl-CoA epoxidase subunit PaaC [Putridiphycobacter roseus]PZE17832.1 phenylacetate-CoA oxygenase subunit PaaI [Putridiphycobacter roseus]
MMQIKITNPFAKFLVRIADSEIILGQRLAEMCSNAPTLEEDIALSNLGLDCFGRGEELMKLVSALENNAFTPDDCVFRRNEREYFCIKLVEQPNNDFAWVVVRQFLHDVYVTEIFKQLATNEHQELAALSQKVLKEIEYSKMHSFDWLVRLGRGTEESKMRTQNALNVMWKYTEELFLFDEIDKTYLSDTDAIAANWNLGVNEMFAAADLERPADKKRHILDFRKGFHSEFLGLILADMQYLPRAYPDAKW